MPAIFWRCAAMGDAPGFYGKAVTRGDFLCRRLPGAFISTWDAWLQSMMGAAQARLGERFLDLFLAMPVWHFALGGGVAAAAPALGVLIPSVDRVGRYFPFSVLGACDAGGTAPEMWSAEVERLALGALADDFDPDALGAALSALGAPGHLADGALPPFGWSGAGGKPVLPPQGETLWWCRGTEHILPATLRSEGLPTRVESTWLIAGPN